MVCELVIKPVVTSRGTYIPFTRHTLVGRLRHLKMLVYDLHDQTAWAYPPGHHALVSRLPYHITDLALLHPESTMSWLEVFRLIWSLRHLQVLQLQMERSPAGGLTDAVLQRLDAIRRPWGCANLKTLVLGDSGSGDCYDFLPERAFGTSVTRLSLTIYQKPIATSAQGALVSQISLFSALEELYVRFRGVQTHSDGQTLGPSDKI
ncbi:hypothetical protein L227DRAFT_617712 [Lentinus tigrinus ALCF2SS1-6]|uniref:F-box domain-containing protein n=1 Tax=Lentinus tigrinus ALCF2SS1-6 TaxID=1328759 RepID=A0A5C2RN60_9APHY|nr:hypothetical protein L227DRAFT_617712 [Lentinus tigrinus ALCF2SS1-6]